MHIDAATLKMLVATGAILLASPSPMSKVWEAIKNRFVPAWVGRILGKLDGPKINDMIDHLATADARLDTAATYLIRLAGTQGIPLEYDTAVAVCKWITRIYADEIAHLRKQKKAAAK
jgi:hypothetical protein